MKQINFSDSFLNQAPELKDITRLTSNIVSDARFSDKKIQINRMRISGGANDLMTTIEIDFQSWGEKESGTGSKWTWIAQRAKDHSCGNYVIEEAKVSKLVKLYQSDLMAVTPKSIAPMKWLRKYGKGLDATQEEIFYHEIK